LELCVVDADLFFDPLGTTVTDEEGTYAVEHDTGTTWTIFQYRPDILIEVRDAGRLLVSTQDTVVRETTSELSIHVEVPGRGPDVNPPRWRNRTKRLAASRSTARPTRHSNHGTYSILRPDSWSRQ
jgi:hypothetical protein